MMEIRDKQATHRRSSIFVEEQEYRFDNYPKINYIRYLLFEFLIVKLNLYYILRPGEYKIIYSVIVLIIYTLYKK